MMHTIDSYEDVYVSRRGSVVYVFRRPSLSITLAGMQNTGSMSCRPG